MDFGAEKGKQALILRFLLRVPNVAHLTHAGALYTHPCSYSRVISSDDSFVNADPEQGKKGVSRGARAQAGIIVCRQKEPRVFSRFHVYNCIKQMTSGNNRTERRRAGREKGREREW